MDDFDIKTLNSSKDEWISRLLNVLTPQIITGFKSIFKEAQKICNDNKEPNKYLMTFQNLITHIAKWNSAIIENEKNRIIRESKCNYLEDLITCVHVIQLKTLSAVRVGQKQKKIDISIPKLDVFIHKVYINCARKLYLNVYLYEVAKPLQTQKNNREIELLIQQCILDTLRDSIPVETILSAYLDETVEEDVVEEIKEEIVEEAKKEQETVINADEPTPTLESSVPSITESEKIIKLDSTGFNEEKITLEVLPSTEIIPSTSTEGHLKFSDIDIVKDEDNKITQIVADKSIETLEKISEQRNNERKLEEALAGDDDEDNEKIKISDDPVTITIDELPF